MADGVSIGDLPAVYRAIASVMEDVGREGIAKGRRNQQQGYSFRGIDDVYNALAPILARHHLIIVPRVLTREKTEQTTQKGGILFYVVVQVEFDIVCATDGSKITACTWGEAMDSADKATNKAMSAAYKYMAMQTFCIPTEGDNDANASHHEIRREAAPSHTPAPAPAPVQTMSKGDARADYGVMVEEMRRVTSSHELKQWGKMNAERVKLQPKDWQAEIRKSYTELMDGLQYAEQASAEAEEELEDAR
jgi:hypothetical protein